MLAWLGLVPHTTLGGGDFHAPLIYSKSEAESGFAPGKGGLDSGPRRRPVLWQLHSAVSPVSPRALLTHSRAALTAGEGVGAERQGPGRPYAAE